jgi:hypothetical protein
LDPRYTFGTFLPPHRLADGESSRNSATSSGIRASERMNRIFQRFAEPVHGFAFKTWKGFS